MQKRSVLNLVILAFGLSLFFNCKDETPKAKEEKLVVSFKKEGVLQLMKANSDSLIKTLDIEIADNDYETQTGLMYRTELGKEQGMLFIFPDVQVRSFYMKNTKIPLDIIYLDGNKTIVSFQKNAKPFDESSLPSGAPAQYVLEINAGLSDEWQLEVGDRMAFQTIE